jgi:1-acyl-sn-glycerol-3-phosphate acyltransferase
MGSSSCTRMLEAVAWCALAVSTDVEHIFDDSDRSNRVAITTLGTVSEATPKKRSTAESRAVREWAFVTGDKRSSLVLYRSVRKLIRMAVFPLLRVQGTNVEVLDLPGPTILAPVHRSHLDSVLLAALSTRRIRALGKESLFLVPVLRYLCAALGAIPVRRGEADREALVAAKTLLDRGESMIVFPEGGRQSPGSPVVDLFDGAAWLASKTGARVVPGRFEVLASKQRAHRGWRADGVSRCHRRQTSRPRAAGGIHRLAPGFPRSTPGRGNSP